MTPPLSHPSNLPEEALPRKEPPKEWLMEVKRSSEAIQIRSPSTTIPCSIKGTAVEAFHAPTFKDSIISKLLARTLLGNTPLASTTDSSQVPWDLSSNVAGSQQPFQSS
jgi:hypothetical protein